MLRFALLILFTLAGFAGPALAQRPPTWVLLGEQTVGFKVDRDVIEVKQPEEWFRSRAFKRLHFVAERNDIHLLEIGVIYLNGYTEDLRIDQKIKRGGTLAVDLASPRSYIKQILMKYRSRLSLRGLADIKVYGEVAPPPVLRPGPPPVAWSEIDTQTFSPRDGRVVFRADRGDGGFGQIALKAVGRRVAIQDVIIRFRNGETQTVGVDQVLREGDETRPIDLDGGRRNIESVVVNLRAERRGPPNRLQLIGIARPARDPGELLGRQTVGFLADRDVIRVGRQEGRFAQILLKVERNDIELLDLKVVYGNGEADDIPVRRVIRKGEETGPLDLKGRSRAIDRVELTYRSRPNFRGEAVVEVYGLK